MADMMKEHSAMMKEEEGQESGWKAMLDHILNNIHDRIQYVTAKNKAGQQEAMGEPEEPKTKGFQKVKEQ